MEATFIFENSLFYLEDLKERKKGIVGFSVGFVGFSFPFPATKLFTRNVGLHLSTILCYMTSIECLAMLRVLDVK